MWGLALKYMKRKLTTMSFDKAFYKFRSNFKESHDTQIFFLTSRNVLLGVQHQCNTFNNIAFCEVDYTVDMSHFAYACKMRCPLNLVLENSEYLWFYSTFCIVITARKQSLRRLCFYRCLSVHGGGWRAWLLKVGGHAWFYLGGMRGFIQGGMRGFIWGGMHGFIRGGCAWFYAGGMCGFIWGAYMVLFGGGMCGFIRGEGACVVLFRGGMHGFFSFSDTMRYGQWVGGYASYWNAFLF